MATPIPSNRCAFTFAEIANAVGASLPKADRTSTSSVSIDSRSAGAGVLFVALRAVRDGHDFLEGAAKAGAGAAIVERGRSFPGLPCFEVDDTLVALGHLARAHLQRMRRSQMMPTIAVGGAAGKTTTKELTAAILRALCGETLATIGNLNNLIGVPMTIFTLEEQHRAAVIECGTNQRGEIERLAAIVRPDSAVVLNVDIEHTEGLGSLEGVADEEAQLFVTARCAVVSTEEDLLLERIPADKPRLTFGTATSADIRIANRTIIGTGQQRVTLDLNPRLVESPSESKFAFELNLLGETAANNTGAALAAVAAAIARPLRHDELRAIASSLREVRAVDGRLQLRDCGGIIVIDDTYNSNPRSLRAALATARQTADGLKSRLILAIGDMLELGDLAAEMHREAISDIAAVNPDATILVGHEMSSAAKTTGTNPLTTASTSNDAARLVVESVRPGDVLLVKGSRGIAMERIIAALPQA
ncbi:MAG TPA: UDP-N-acetylmuramoyl-tripeptide--D-alanyl-D-alanine ligase [Candidatus Binataceae bacterium]|nr:UDP-N-acetylmuramoyl-tripeptide--D-alanyl-D-alanine ligase [Candidatus Binataceae bacterium]